MKSYLELIQQTLLPPTKVYQDNEGNYAGSQVDIYPAIRLFSRAYGFVIFIKWITWSIWAPFGYWIVKWWIKKNDVEMSRADPSGWPERKRKMLLKYKLLMYLWISYMTYGYLNDWSI